MKIPLIIFLALFYLSITQQTHNIVLSPSGSTIDDTPLVEEAINGVSEIPNSVLITEPNTYVLQGEYVGHVFVKLNETENATLILNGVNITNPNGPGIVISRAREIDDYDYSREDPITVERAKKVDWANVGIRIIIADDSENIVNAGHDDDYDGAFFSKVSMVIDGGVKGNGKLTIIADSEGLDSKRHMQINGGIFNIVANDDGINPSKDYGSVLEINGGTLRINGGQSQSRGDGIDCNGILIINGGDVISSGYGIDSGFDGTSGIIINGGIAIGAGSMIDRADDGCKQPTMNLMFKSNVDPKKVLTIEDSKKNVIVRFSIAEAGFVEGSKLNSFNTLIVSHPKFETFKIYKVFLDGVQLSYNLNGDSWSFGPPDGPGGDPMGPGGNPPDQGGNPPMLIADDQQTNNQTQEDQTHGGGGPPDFPWGNNRDSGSNKDKKGDNYYKVNENNANEKGEEDNDDSSEEDEEVEYRSIFMLTKNVETFSGVTQV